MEQIETLNVQITTNQKLKIKVDSNYVIIKGLTKVEPSWNAEVETFSTFEMEGWSDAQKVGMGLSFSFEGYEVPGDPGNDAIVAAIPKMGNEGNGQFQYNFANGAVMEFAGVIEGNWGGGEVKKLSPISGTITVKGIPNITDADA